MQSQSQSQSQSQEDEFIAPPSASEKSELFAMIDDLLTRAANSHGCYERALAAEAEAAAEAAVAAAAAAAAEGEGGADAADEGAEAEAAAEDAEDAEVVGGAGGNYSTPVRPTKKSLHTPPPIERKSRDFFLHMKEE